MPGTIFSNRIFSALRRFAKADQGNIAVMLAFAALPILAAVGAAIDYSRVNNARTSLQAAPMQKRVEPASLAFVA